MEAFEIRMQVEFSQLNYKLQKLDSFLRQQEVSQKVDDVELALLKQQLVHMKNYRDVLLQRCKIHHII